MFQKLRELLRGESLLDQSYDETVAVLETLKGMVALASDSLRRSDEALELDSVFGLDRKINKYQRRTRRKILIHVAVSPSTDINAALVLASIIIDVERIGDYAKNIVELARAHPSRLAAGPYEEALVRLEERVATGLVDVRRALEVSDLEISRKYVKTHREYTTMSDEIVDGLIVKDDGIEKGTAVVLALYVRYLKRIESHLINIVSSVVNPFHRIGFRVKGEASDS